LTSCSMLRHPTSITKPKVLRTNLLYVNILITNILLQPLLIKTCKFIYTSLLFFITALSHFPLHLIVYIPMFCHCSLFLHPTVLISICVSILQAFFSNYSHNQIFVASHPNMWLQSSFCHVCDKSPSHCSS
jgi:hypothetical protein